MSRLHPVLCALAVALVGAAGQTRPAPIAAEDAGPGPGVPAVPAVPSSASVPAAPAAAVPPPRAGCTLGAYHPVGDTWFTSGREGCLKYTCQRSGVVSSQPCPRVLAPEGCSVKEGDADALFPACCPQRVCAAPAPATEAVPVPAAVPAAAPAAPDTTTSTAAPTTTATSTTSSESTSTTGNPSSTTPGQA